MTDSSTTILQMPPQDFWGLVLALSMIVGVLVTYLVLSNLGKAYRPPSWEQESALTIAVVMVLGVLWLGLFGMTIWAAFVGTYQLLRAHSGTPISATPNSGLGALGLGTLLAGLLSAPFLIWSTVIKHRALGFQKEGHLTDRISAAVEQLGAEKTVKKDDKETTVPNIEVRIGGILSLERIAQDSTSYDNGRDHVRVMEILCAYIRHNAPASEAKDHDFGEWVPLGDYASEEERAAHLERLKVRFGSWMINQGQVYHWAQSLPEPRADIAIALRVIGRRTPAQRLAEARWGKDAGPNDKWVFDEPSPKLSDDPSQAELSGYLKELQDWRVKIDHYKGYSLDLRATNLQRVDLSDLALSGAKLNAVRMEGANLRQVRMEGANLSLARLDGADLWRAHMSGAILQLARMEGADLSQARMEGAEITQANIGGANFWRTRMDLSNLNSALMESAILWQTKIRRSNLVGVRAMGAVFPSASMGGADLSGARIDSASMLHTANLSQVKIGDFDLSAIPVSVDQIKIMFGDSSVILPNGVTPTHPDWPAHWPKFKFGLLDSETEWQKWKSDPAAYVPPVEPDSDD